MLPQKVAGRYEIRRELGRGMMGVVYEAHDATLGRLVALKTIQVPRAGSPDEREAFERRFVTEARVAARLSHPNIVTVHDVGRDPESGVLFMALEYLRGQTLAQVAANGPTPWRDALQVTASLANALHHAHANEIIHRDIKPANVMVQPSGEPKIMDFGIAKVPASDLTADGQIFGSPSYMSPEQAMGKPVDLRSDIFSLGTVLYQILTGQTAFGGDTLPLIVTALLQEDPKAPSLVVPGIPQTADAIVACALAKEPEDRYPSGHGFAEDIEDVLAGRSPRNAGRFGRAAGDETQLSLGPRLEEGGVPGGPHQPGVPGVAGGPVGSGEAPPAPSPIAAARSPASLGTRRSVAAPEGRRPSGASRQSSAHWGRALALVGAGLTLLGAGLVAGRLLTWPGAPSDAATSSPATPVPSSEPKAPAAGPETPSSTPTQAKDAAPTPEAAPMPQAATAPEATPASLPTHAKAPLSSGRTTPGPDRTVEPARAAPVAAPEEPGPEPRPVRVKAEPAASSPHPTGERAAAEVPAQLFVDFEHALKEGYLRIWVDGVPVLDTDIEGRVRKKIVGIKWRKGHLEHTLEVSPGRHAIQVQVSWDDKQKTETIRGRFESDSRRILEVRLGRIRKNLDLEWR